MTEDEWKWIDGEGIRARLRASGKTQRELGAALGIDPSGVSRVLGGARKLRDDELARIRSFFDPTAVPAVPPASYRLGPLPGEQRSSRPRPGPPPRHRASGDIPVYGAPKGSGDPFFEFPAGPPAEYRPRPEQLLGVEDAFAIFAPGDVLAPRYRSAETLYIHPSKPPLVGSDCFVRMLEPERGVAILRHLGGEGSVVRFCPVSSLYPCTAVPHREILTLELGKVARIGRIVLIATD